MLLKIKAENLQSLGENTLKSKEDNKKTAIRVSENRLNIISYSNITYFTASADLEEVIEASDEWIAIDSDTLKRYLSVLPKNDAIITIDNSEDSRLTIKNGKSVFRIPIVLGEKIKEEKNLEELATVDIMDFSNKIADVNKLTSKSTHNDKTQFLHLLFEKDGIKLMGTDKVAIAEHVISADSDREESFLFTSNMINLFPVINTSEPWTLVKTETRFGLKDLNNNLYLIGVVDESPLNYKPIKSLVVKPDDSEYRSVTLDSKEFKKKISDMSKINNNSASLGIAFTQDGFFIYNREGDRIEINSDYDNSMNLTMGMNMNSLLVLSNIFAGDIKMSFRASDQTERVFRTVVRFENVDSPDLFMGVSTDDK